MGPARDARGGRGGGAFDSRWRRARAGCAASRALAASPLGPTLARLNAGGLEGTGGAWEALLFVRAGSSSTPPCPLPVAVEAQDRCAACIGTNAEVDGVGEK